MLITTKLKMMHNLYTKLILNTFITIFELLNTAIYTFYINTLP